MTWAFHVDGRPIFVVVTIIFVVKMFDVCDTVVGNDYSNGDLDDCGHNRNNGDDHNDVEDDFSHSYVLYVYDQYHYDDDDVAIMKMIMMVILAVKIILMTSEAVMNVTVVIMIVIT